MAVLGPDTPALGEMKNLQLYQKQLAKTLAEFFGVNYQNEFAVGEPVGSMIHPTTLIPLPILFVPAPLSLPVTLQPHVSSPGQDLYHFFYPK